MKPGSAGCLKPDDVMHSILLKPVSVFISSDEINGDHTSKGRVINEYRSIRYWWYGIKNGRD